MPHARLLGLFYRVYSKEGQAQIPCSDYYRDLANAEREAEALKAGIRAAGGDPDRIHVIGESIYLGD